MATQKGTVGAQFGIPGTPSIAVGDADPLTIIRTYNYSREADSKEAGGLTGDVISSVFHNVRERMTVDVLVTGTAMSDALALFVDACRAPGTDVEITGLTDTQADSEGDGSDVWHLESVGKTATQDDFGTISLTLVRYAVDLNALNT